MLLHDAFLVGTRKLIGFLVLVARVALCMLHDVSMLCAKELASLPSIVVEKSVQSLSKKTLGPLSLRKQHVSWQNGKSIINSYVKGSSAPHFEPSDPHAMLVVNCG
jgi:hypothetical protein